MRDSMKHEIDGKTYTITQLPPKQALKITIRLGKILSRPIGGAVGALQFEPGGQDNGLNIDPKGIEKGIIGLFENLNEDETIDTVEQLLSAVMFEGQVMKLESKNFQGHTMHMLKVAAKSAEVNFSDFFDERYGVGAIIAKLKTMTQARAMSTGQSGE